MIGFEVHVAPRLLSWNTVVGKPSTTPCWQKLLLHTCRDDDVRATGRHSLFWLKPCWLKLFQSRSELSLNFKHCCVCVFVFLCQESLSHGPQARTGVEPTRQQFGCASWGRHVRWVDDHIGFAGLAGQWLCVCSFVNSNDAICLDIGKDLELCTDDIQGIAVNFLITDRPEPVSLLVRYCASFFEGQSGSTTTQPANESRSPPHG